MVELLTRELIRMWTTQTYSCLLTTKGKAVRRPDILKRLLVLLFLISELLSGVHHENSGNVTKGRHRT